MIRRALSLALVAALVIVPASVQAARRAHPHAATAIYSVALSPDPLTTGPENGTATVTTDQYGWLRVQTPCVDGWTNLAPGTSDIAFYRACAGNYTFTITTAGDENGVTTDLYSVTVTSQ